VTIPSPPRGINKPVPHGPKNPRRAGKKRRSLADGTEPARTVTRCLVRAARFARPEDMGWAAVRLCSAADSAVTGAVLPADGGAQVGF
jgi:hypothetical protein